MARRGDVRPVHDAIRAAWTPPGWRTSRSTATATAQRPTGQPGRGSTAGTARAAGRAPAEPQAEPDRPRRRPSRPPRPRPRPPRPRRRPRARGDPAAGGQGGRAGQGHRPPGAEGDEGRPRRPRRATSRRTPCCAARPARTVANMDDSLSVPTATSVRSVPVKLLWDNRIVINNHLVARPRRQGVVHPPDRLRAGQGAQVDAGDERRLRRHRRQAQPDHAGPHQPRPRHRHAEAGRHPPAPRAQHQGRRDDGLRRLLDRLRGHRAQGPQRQAHRRGLPGHDDLADQPRHHRHQPLGAAPDARPGRDHRRRRDGVPPGVPGRLRRHDRPQRDQQGDDADLDLRPPGHPGRAVGRVPQARPRRCCSARTASTTRSSARCGSPTSRSAGRTTSRGRTTTRSASRPGSSS